MDTILTPLMAEQDRRLTETISQERSRLRNFIRQRVPDPAEAEDILQDVFYEFVAAYRLPQAIEQVGAWLFRVARNRIVDRFRKKREVALSDERNDAGDEYWLEQVLGSADADGPDAAYARALLIETLYEALEELPRNQREVFVAHELEGRSFKDMAAESGVGVNTLLARKRYAVLHLRVRLQDIYDEFNTREQKP
jgi:RNA polymerase sigma factor (sigma-70 family)